MADISIAIDIPLMHAIAQSSATFVAILAGFYIAKILSISGDMRRITVKIREYDNEIGRETSDIQSLASRINRIERDGLKKRLIHSRIPCILIRYLYVPLLMTNPYFQECLFESMNLIRRRNQNLLNETCRGP